MLFSVIELFSEMYHFLFVVITISTLVYNVTPCNDKSTGAHYNILITLLLIITLFLITSFPHMIILTIVAIFCLTSNMNYKEIL